MIKLLLATRSAGKLREIRRILSDTSIDVVSLADIGAEESEEEERLEESASFTQNALSKARYFHRLSGIPTLADDSGLVVDALDGGPGVRSKRFAPPEWQSEHGVDRANILYLLKALDSVPDAERSAHFHCSMALVMEGVEEVFDGRVDGVILREPRGSGGFGYDPLFLLPQRGVTAAELSPDEKNLVSHRGRAARKARDWLVARSGAETSAPRTQ